MFRKFKTTINRQVKLYPKRGELLNHLKAVVNRVDYVYKKLDVRVVLSHVEIWTEDEVYIGSDIYQVKQNVQNDHNSCATQQFTCSVVLLCFLNNLMVEKVFLVM